MIIFSLKSQTLIFSNGLDDNLKHGGKLWTCSSCLNKEGLLAGYSKKEDFLSNHKGCTLFMENILSDSAKKGWGKNMDRKTGRQGPFGRPEGHLWTWTAQTESPATRQATKTTPDLQQARYKLINLEQLPRVRSYAFSLNESSESVNEKMKNILILTSTEKSDVEENLRPKSKRKAATDSCKKPIIEDELDDSDDDAHYELPGKESSSEDDSILSDNNNDAEVPAKRSRK